jgi:uncharacterized protein (UPF0262 family)
MGSYRVAVWDAKKILDTDGGDGGTTSMHLIPLNGILKMVKVAYFLLCTFYYNKKSLTQMR